MAGLFQVGGQLGRRRVGVIAPDRVEHVDAVAPQLLGGDRERILAFLDEARVSRSP